MPSEDEEQQGDAKVREKKEMVDDMDMRYSWIYSRIWGVVLLIDRNNQDVA
jgi:hypothetical protein